MSAQSFNDDTMLPSGNSEFDSLRIIRNVISKESPYLPTFFVQTLEKLGDGDKPKFPVKKAVLCLLKCVETICSLDELDGLKNASRKNLGLPNAKGNSF